MNYTDWVTQVKSMTQAEKLALLRVLADSLSQNATMPMQKRAKKHAHGKLRVNQIADPQETPERRAKRLASLPSAEEMTGVIPVGNHVPTDEEIKEDYANYLVNKYK
jgi:hypothetical protein